MRHRMLGGALVLLVAGCAGIPAGLVPEGMTPAITLDPARWTAPTTAPPESTPAATPQPGATARPTPRPTIVPTGAPTPVPTPAPAASPAVTLDTLEATVLRLTNDERAKQGLGALTGPAPLMTLARGRSQDMAVRNYFDHTNPDGQTAFDLMRAAGISYTTAGENIAYNNYGVGTAATEVVKAWMNSSGHRANILNGRFGRIGVGAWVRADGRIYFTQVFTN